MKNLILIAGLVMLFQNLHAYNTKGMKVYKKVCLECHGSPYRGAKMYTIMEWEMMYEGSKTPLKDVHKKHKQALEVINSEYFSNKRQKYLKEFLIENAKNAGSVPGCDGNYCGS